MATVVVKLGSSIVADERGEVRADVLGAVCDQVAARHAGGRRHGGGDLGRHRARHATDGAADAPERRWRSSRPPRRSARASSTATTTSCSRSAACGRAQVLLTFFDMSARTHYLNARHTLRKLLDWRVVPVINENDTTTTDEISFGDNDFLAAQVAILLGADLLVLLTDTGGLYTADPRTRSGGRADRRRARAWRQLERYEIGLSTLAARLGRDALEGGGGGDGHRRRASPW